MEENIFTLDQSFLNREYTNTAFKIYKILNAYQTSTEKGIRVANEYFKSKGAFEKVILSFIKQYSNADEFVNDLYAIADTYDKKDKKPKSVTYIDRNKFKVDNSEKKELLMQIYKSGLSVLDYLFYNNEPIGFTKFFNEKCSQNDNVALEINSRVNKTYPILIGIINSINEGKLDYVGYYEATKLNPYYLIAIARENDLYTDQFAAFIRALRLNKQINVENELNGVLVINEEHVPRSVKEEAINYLNTINAPMDIVLYNNMVRRLIKKSSK